MEYQNGSWLINGRANYPVILQTITVVSLFVGAFWVGIIAPIDNDIQRIQGQFLTIREHAEYQNRVAEQFKGLEQAIRDLQVQITKNREDFPSRKESEAHWENFEERLRVQALRLNELAQTFAQGYTLTDEVRNLQRQLDDLRTPRLNLQTAPPPLPAPPPSSRDSFR